MATKRRAQSLPGSSRSRKIPRTTKMKRIIQTRTARTRRTRASLNSTCMRNSRWQVEPSRWIGSRDTLTLLRTGWLIYTALSSNILGPCDQIRSGYGQRKGCCSVLSRNSCQLQRAGQKSSQGKLQWIQRTPLIELIAIFTRTDNIWLLSILIDIEAVGILWTSQGDSQDRERGGHVSSRLAASVSFYFRLSSRNHNTLFLFQTRTLGSCSRLKQ